MSAAPARPFPPRATIERSGGDGAPAQRSAPRRSSTQGPTPHGSTRQRPPIGRAAAPARRAASRRPAPNQPGLFEADPYRVARPAPARRSAAPRPAPQREAPAVPVRRPDLAALAAPEHSRSLVPFVALCVAIVVGSLVAVLLLNTSMAKGAYETRDLRNELSYLDDQRSELRAALEAHASPQALARAAAELGMVPAPHVGFVTIGTGSVIAPGAKP